MKIKLQYCLFIIFCLVSHSGFAQNISLYEQFNGRYDFVFIGNTMNTEENNNFFAPCFALTSSSATLALQPQDHIEKAFLYWAGSGPGDFNVKLNNQNITAERRFSHNQTTDGITKTYFSAFADVTQMVKSTGNANYTLSDLDISAVIENFCTNGTNFAGWSIVVVYKNESLPLFQINVYDGFQGVPSEINILLTNLNVIDIEGAQIGFIAWEGDQNLSDNETLSVNDRIIGNPPLNPPNNAFNGTNSFTGSSSLYNMDLDVYDIRNNIRPGDQTARIKLTSSRDVVMISTIVTKLNSLLPDATISIDQVALACDSRQIVVDYTVSNLNSTDLLRSAVPISIYADGQFLARTPTRNAIAIGASESGQFSLTVPENIPTDFNLEFSVDDNGSGVGIVAEINEDNNDFTIPISLWLSPEVNQPESPKACNIGFGRGIFNFSDYGNLAITNPLDTFAFYENAEDAENQNNAIANTSNFPTNGPTPIFIRVDNEHCHTIASFLLQTNNCPPRVYNFISANGDNLNDDFSIDGLRDIFTDFKLSVYNRWGRLIWTGNNNSPEWTGEAVKGTVFLKGKVPDGTYFYVLELNDAGYPKPLTGYLYFSN